jgi:hypothetical protein
MRYRLSTLLILLTVAPPMLAAGWLGIERFQAWRSRDHWVDVRGPGIINAFEPIICRFDESDEADGTELVEDDPVMEQPVTYPD